MSLSDPATYRERLAKAARAIRRGARVVIATPGRLEDFLNRGLVKLDQVNLLVLDEVDRMLDMGFFDDIATVARQAAVQKCLAAKGLAPKGGVEPVKGTWLGPPLL